MSMLHYATESMAYMVSGTMDRESIDSVIVVVVYHVTIVAIGHGKFLPLVIDCVLRTLQGIQLMNKTFTEILTQPQSSIELLTDMPMISK